MNIIIKFLSIIGAAAIVLYILNIIPKLIINLFFIKTYNICMILTEEQIKILEPLALKGLSLFPPSKRGNLWDSEERKFFLKLEKACRGMSTDDDSKYYLYIYPDGKGEKILFQALITLKLDAIENNNVNKIEIINSILDEFLEKI